MDRTFLRISADPLARGLAWRAIKRAVGPDLPIRWQRHASHEQVMTMLSRAVAMTRDPRVQEPI